MLLAAEVYTLVTKRLTVFIFVFVYITTTEANSTTPFAAKLSLQYRLLSNDYQSSPELIQNIFLSFESITKSSQQPIEHLATDSDFLNSMETISKSLNELLAQQNNEQQKQDNIEAIVAIVTEHIAPSINKDNRSIANMYHDYLNSILKTNTKPIDSHKIKIKINDVIKTVGTYGIWGFWFVTSTWGLVQYSPEVSHFLYYPAVAMFLASGPFSVSNQIWFQVFDRLEKKAALKHQSAVEYLKDRVLDLRNRWANRSLEKKFNTTNFQCVKYYTFNHRK